MTERYGEPPARPCVILACRVLQSLFERSLPPGLAGQVTFLEYGLHGAPPTMARTLQATLDALPEPSLVILGYGLCGNGLKDLQAGSHTLLLPRVDDCITLLLGSREAYLREARAVPGTFYLSKGWLESGSDPLREHESYVARYGEETALWLSDQQYHNYRRLALVAEDEAGLAECRPEARRVADFCARWGMRYEEILGSEAYIRRLVEVAGQILRGDAPSLGDDFLVVRPGEANDPTRYYPRG